MHSLSILTAAIVALSGANASPCALSPGDTCKLYDIPATAICGGTGWRGNPKAGWYKVSKDPGTLDACIKSCSTTEGSNCTAISWDPNDKTCRYYGYTVQQMQLSGTSSYKYYDACCGFETAVGATCGKNGWVGADDLEPYANQVVTDKVACAAYCHYDSECKAVRFNANGKRCYKYNQPVSATGVTFNEASPNVFYDTRCYECTSTVQVV